MMTSSDRHGNTKTTNTRMSLVAALILVFSGGIFLATFTMQHPQHHSLQRSHVHNDIMGEDTSRLSLHGGHDDDDDDDDDDDGNDDGNDNDDDDDDDDGNDDDDDAIAKDHVLNNQVTHLEFQVSVLEDKSCKKKKKQYKQCEERRKYFEERVMDCRKEKESLLLKKTDLENRSAEQQDEISSLINQSRILELQVSKLEENCDNQVSDKAYRSAAWKTSLSNFKGDPFECKWKDKLNRCQRRKENVQEQLNDCQAIVNVYKEEVIGLENVVSNQKDTIIFWNNYITDLKVYVSNLEENCHWNKRLNIKINDLSKSRSAS